MRFPHFFVKSTAWKVSKYGVISGPYFPVFRLNTGKYGPEVTSYLGTFNAVIICHTFESVQHFVQHVVGEQKNEISLVEAKWNFVSGRYRK